MQQALASRFRPLLVHVGNPAARRALETCGLSLVHVFTSLDLLDLLDLKVFFDVLDTLAYLGLLVCYVKQPFDRRFPLLVSRGARIGVGLRSCGGRSDSEGIREVSVGPLFRLVHRFARSETREKERKG